MVFTNWELTWSVYPITQALLIIWQVEIIDWKEFTKAVLNENVKAFIVYYIFSSLRLIYLSWKSQIILLLSKKVTVLTKYSDFKVVFSKKISCRATYIFRH